MRTQAPMGRGEGHLSVDRRAMLRHDKTLVTRGSAKVTLTKTSAAMRSPEGRRKRNTDWVPGPAGGI